MYTLTVVWRSHTNTWEILCNELPHFSPLCLLREQRVTLFVMAVLLSVSVMLYHVLRLLPLPVLYGIFLYIGVASLYGVQVS